MKPITNMLWLCLASFSLSAQVQLDVIGESLFSDVNKIAIFRSSGNNAFLTFENNNGASSASFGHFDTGGSRYFFWDTPLGECCEMVLRGDGRVGINTMGSNR